MNFLYAPFNFLGSIFGYLLWAIFYVVQNYGVAIIIFAVIFALLRFPFSIRQQKSMAANARMQAKQKEIKEKYANDKQKQNEEMQKLYEKEGASPLSGCLTSILPMFVMLGLFYSVARPLTNTLHIAADKVTQVQNIVNGIPGVSVGSSGLYTEIDILRIFNNPSAFALLQKNTDISSILSGDEISRIQHLAGGFRLFGLDLLTTPKNMGFASVYIIIPILIFVTSIGSQLFMMRMNGSPMNNQQGCMKYSMLLLPLLTVYISWIVPAAVGFYWIINTILGFVQSLVLNKFYSPAMVTSKAEAQHVALLELQEAKIPKQ